MPLEPRHPSHHLCVARLPAGGDWTAGQHGQWDGQKCCWAGQERMSRAAYRAHISQAAAADASAEQQPASHGGAAGGAGSAEGADSREAAVAVQPPAQALQQPVGEVAHELRWCIVPADWVWLSSSQLQDGAFAGAPGTAVHKLDEGLRVSRHRFHRWCSDRKLRARHTAAQGMACLQGVLVGTNVRTSLDVVAIAAPPRPPVVGPFCTGGHPGAAWRARAAAAPRLGH